MNDLSLTNPFRSLIAALEKRDEYTAGHDQRTKLIALDIGEQCNLEAEELAILEIAASVHDIGKIGIPDRILLKPGRLDAEEWEVMKTHPLNSQKYRGILTYSYCREVNVTLSPSSVA